MLSIFFFNLKSKFQFWRSVYYYYFVVLYPNTCLNRYMYMRRA